MMMKIGMIVTWLGTISEASSTMNSMLRPGKRSRANAKPAIEQVISWPRTTKKVILMLLSAKARKGTDELKTAA